MTTKQKKKETSSPKKDKLTLEDALSKGIVILKEDVNKIINEEVDKIRSKLIKDAKNQAAQDIVDKRNKSDHMKIKDYMTTSGITDEKFCLRLIRMGVVAREATLLRNDQSKMDRKKIWAFIRANYAKLR